MTSGHSTCPIDLIIESDVWNNANIDLKKTAQETIIKTLNETPQGKIILQSGLKICCVLADNMFVKILNANYRNQDKPTNILSFPMVEIHNPEDITPESLDNPMLSAFGDLILAYETIDKEAKEQEKSFHNHYTHLIIHGVLHLMGYDHINEDDAKLMETLEIKILNTLNIDNPYI